MRQEISLKNLKRQAKKYLYRNKGKKWDFDLSCDLNSLLDSRSIREFRQIANDTGTFNLFFYQSN